MAPIEPARVLLTRQWRHVLLGLVALGSVTVAGTVWCPVLQHTMKVLGAPAAFVGTVGGFDDVRRCERFGNGGIECHKWCIKAGDLAQAARSN